MSFASPLALALGALAVPLVALYFLRLRKRRVVVPSLLLWAQFAQAERLATPFERFRRSLLLLVQLLLLALLVLAAARPYTEGRVTAERSVVIVIDTSASMGATDTPPTRFSQAVLGAQRAVAALGPGDEGMIVEAGARTSVAVPFSRDKKTLVDGLAALRLTEAEGRLRDGLELALSLARSRPGVEVLVFSDGSGEALADVDPRGVPLTLVPVGSSSRNVGIVALELRAAGGSVLDRQLFVTVHNFGDAPADAAVEVWLDGDLQAMRNATLPADEPLSLVFDLAGAEGGVVRVHVEADDDALPADDEAFAVAMPAAERSVLVVGGDALTLRALAADPRLDVRAIPASALALGIVDRFDAVLIGAAPPPGIDLDGRAVAWLRPVDGGPVRYGADVRGPEVLGWRRTHATQRFVSWDGVVIARSRTVLDTGGLSPVVDGGGGPLVLAGDRGGRPVVAFAFDPFESDLPLRVAWPVLLLNTVGWLTDAGGGESALVATGAPFTWPVPTGGERVTATDPGGRAVDVAVVDDLARVRATDRVGVYHLRAGEREVRFAANLLSARESRIAPRGELGLGGGGAAGVQASVLGRRELWRPLLWGALVVLLLEWLLWNRRRA